MDEKTKPSQVSELDSSEKTQGEEIEKAENSEEDQDFPDYEDEQPLDATMVDMGGALNLDGEKNFDDDDDDEMDQTNLDELLQKEKRKSIFSKIFKKK